MTNCEQIREWVSGNIFIRAIHLDAGESVPAHKHNFDHTSIVFKGAVFVKTPERNGEFRAPAHCLIKKDVLHEITALEDGTEFWCVYAHRDAQGEVVQEANGNIEAYGIVD